MGDVLCETIQYEWGTNPYHINCGSVTTGSVTIVGGLNKDGVLTLCEVQVYSSNAPGKLPLFDPIAVIASK